MRLLTFYLIVLIQLQSFAQVEYQNALKNFHNCIEKNDTIKFKDAVFLVENTYLNQKISKSDFDMTISGLVGLSILYGNANKIIYQNKDENLINTYASVFKVFTDTVNILHLKDTLYHLPYTYDFNDIFGNHDWEQMFVIKLLATHKGNCHSLPYLYKIVCGELNVPCNLALAPNHMYIKHRSIKGGMYNTELTSATFPIDAWLMASGYISLEAVQKGIYLDTLSEKESISLCVLDLAQGYNHKYANNDGKFVIECCDLALKYFPNYVNAILLKAETRLKQLQTIQKQYGYAYLKDVIVFPEAKALWDEMNSLYMQLYTLGYRQMPEQMYVDWLTSLKTEREKYTNKQVEQLNRN